MIKHDFAPHFALKLMRKDLELMKQTAEELQLVLPVTEAVRRLFADSEAAGKGELDYSAIFAQLTGASVHAS
jgi:3-hydroxyisobutyrate dehydrogenase-like beta-hydroxyacid dehydrogenase